MVFIFVSWLFFNKREPVSQGRKLSEWAQEVKFLDPDSLPLQPDDSTRAIQEIGTNAIPYAVRWLSTDPRDKVKAQCENLVDKFNGSQSWFNFDTKIFERPPKWGWAIGIFYALGTNARPAIPQLASLLEGSDVNASRGAAEALSQIGVESIPFLLNSLVSTNRNAVELSICSLQMLGTNSLSAVPTLLDYLHRDFQGLGDDCALALFRIDPDSPDFLRAMIQRIKTQFPRPTFATYAVLERLGTNAIAAVPLLVDIIEMEDSLLKSGRAVHVLCKIDPITGENYATMLKAEIEARQATNQVSHADYRERYFRQNLSTNAPATNHQNIIEQ